MSKKLKIAIILLFTIGLAGFGGYNYVMHGGARDIASEETDFTVTSKSISDEFKTNTDTSNKKYLEKAVAISGTITEIRASEIVIDNTIICTLKTPDATIKKDQKVTVKGRIVGYDDLFGELKLDQSFINK